jgi:hypothetical protein
MKHLHVEMEAEWMSYNEENPSRNEKDFFIKKIS